MRLKRAVMTIVALCAVPTAVLAVEPHAGDIHVRVVRGRPGIDAPRNEGVIEVYNSGSLFYKIRIQRQFTNVISGVPANHRTCPTCTRLQCDGEPPSTTTRWAHPSGVGYVCESYTHDPGISELPEQDDIPIETMELGPCNTSNFCKFAFDCMPGGGLHDCDNVLLGPYFCADYAQVHVEIVGYKTKASSGYTLLPQPLMVCEKPSPSSAFSCVTESRCDGVVRQPCVGVTGEPPGTPICTQIVE